MTLEGHETDCKSLRLVTGKTANWDELACACVCFSNGVGGKLLIGIEDGEHEPPADQTIPTDLPDRIRKRVGELTVNVQALPSIQRAPNGGAYIELAIDRSPGVASTSDGHYFMRIADRCQPVVGDNILRLASERPAYSWEMVVTNTPRTAVDPGKLARFIERIRASERVKQSVKEKSTDELLIHYDLMRNQSLTRLGVLMLGTAADRRALGTAPIIQAIKYDDQGKKVNKWLWDDCALAPDELVDTVWNEVQDFRESYEVLEGLFRHQIPAYDKDVVRELLVNALVHRPYTQRGDIFLNLSPDALEIVNPGRLPLGVTPQNILHASRRRNDGLARIFHDIHLMEREGSGFDLMYERLLSQGRPVPVPEEGEDFFKVGIRRRIMKLEVIQLIAEANATFQLSQRERITLGILAQSEGKTARELATILEIRSADELTQWLGRLPKLRLVSSTGRTQAKRYFVDPQLLRVTGVAVPTSLVRIESHRLNALVLEDLRRHPNSRIGEINPRIGKEIPRSRLRRTLGQLVATGKISMSGRQKGARYSIQSSQ